MRITLAVALQAVAAIMLFEAGGHHRYGYYRNLRLVVTAACLGTVYLLLNASLKHVRHAAWIFGAGAFLFNPIIPFYLNRSDWERIDTTMGALMVIGAVTVAGDTLWSMRRRHDGPRNGAPRNA